MGNGRRGRGGRKGKGGRGRRGGGRKGGGSRSRKLKWRDAMDQEIWDLRGRLVEIRRDLHRHPELAFEETRTAKTIAEHLDDLGLEVEEEIVGTGVVGLLEGGRPGPCVLWRADMDALPVQETQKGDYTSRNDGVAHVCGHDGHMAIALGIASVLSERREELAGSVKFMFQPGEEGGGGAKKMVDAAVLKKPDVDAAFGLHLDTDLQTGAVALSEGETMASSADFEIHLRGQGGHAATPHLTADPVVAGSLLVSALQTIVSRQVDPTEEVVLTVGSFQGGTAENVIPKEVTLRGTVRAFDEKIKKEILERVESLSRGIADGFDLECKVKRHRGYPTSVNDPDITRQVREILADLLGNDAIEPMRLLGSEDMAFILQQVPGCYFLVGGRNDSKGCVHPHHSPDFDFDEDALPVGVVVGSTVLESYLEANAEQAEERDSSKRRSRGRGRGRGGKRDSGKGRGGGREKQPPAEEEEEVVAAEEEEILEEVGEDGDPLKSLGYVDQEFQRIRRRRRRGGSREKREALLPEHLGPRARDAEKEAVRKLAKEAPPRKPEEEEPEEELESAELEAEEEIEEEIEDAADEDYEDEEEDDSDEDSGSEDEEDGEEEEESEEPAEVGASDEEEVSPQVKRMEMARSISSVKEDDLVPMHKRSRKKNADEEKSEESDEEEGRTAPWLWKGRKTRR